MAIAPKTDNTFIGKRNLILKSERDNWKTFLMNISHVSWENKKLTRQKFSKIDFAASKRPVWRPLLRLLGRPYTWLYERRSTGRIWFCRTAAYGQKTIFEVVRRTLYCRKSVESRILFSLLTVEVSLLLYHVLLSLEQSRNHLPLCRNLQVFVEGIGARLLISFHPLLDLNL